MYCYSNFDEVKLFVNGKCVAIVRSLKGKPGEIVINAKADGIKIEACTVKSI